jgi:hypothetical protein
MAVKRLLLLEHIGVRQYTISHDTTRRLIGLFLRSRFLLFVRAESFASVVDLLTQLGHLRTEGIGSKVSFLDHFGVEAETHGGVSEGYYGTIGCEAFTKILFRRQARRPTGTRVVSHDLRSGTSKKDLVVFLGTNTGMKQDSH